MAYCGYCGKFIADGYLFCSHCGRPVTNTKNAGQSTPEEPISQSSDNKSNSSSSFVGGINDYIGNSNPVQLNWKDLFSDVFKKHTDEEAEDIFICGTSKTTPPLDKVSETWPKPWLYSRVFLCFAITYLLLNICWTQFQNTNVLPGLIIVGSFAVPFTTMVLFMEVNAYRNISVYEVMKFFLIGGCASLVVTLFIYSLRLVDTSLASTWGAMMVGVIEELGKLAIVYVLISKMKSCNNILSALLVGACVGAGFAAFESAGYAFNVLLDRGINGMTNTIYLRGLFAPGGHVAWAAISGAALVIAKGSNSLTTDVLANKQFLKIFAIPIVLHGLWDAPIFPGYPKWIALIVVVWIVVLILINMGLDEVKKLKQNQDETMQ
jgi:RsiW-degrading membrane proteinase PrsW (M82 family)